MSASRAMSITLVQTPPQRYPSRFPPDPPEEASRRCAGRLFCVRALPWQPGARALGSPANAAILSEVPEARPPLRRLPVSPSGAEFIRQIKSQIAEVDPAEVHAALNGANGNGEIAVVDVRESDEIAQGHLPGAKLVPRGYLESRIEGAVPDRSQHVVLYCASGNRSALAAKTLDRPRLRERRVDDRRDHAVEGPRLQGRRAAQDHRRAARALQPPHARAGDRRRGPVQAARREGAAARRRRAGLADRAVPRGRRRRHDRDRRRRRRRPLQPAAPGHPHDRPHRRAEGRLGRDHDEGAEPRRRRRSSTRRGSTPRTSWRSSRATT